MKNISSAEFRYSILCISGQYFGVEVKFVQEVLSLPLITKIPNVHHSVLGVFNLRGQIQSVIDIRGFLNLPIEDINDEDFVVIVDFNETKLGIVVEKVLDVFSIDGNKIQIPTRDMPLSLIQYCNGYYSHKKLGKIFLLDLETLFNAKEIVSYSYSLGV
ncbi:MAG: purine-binding chemotaxis protein CheW [Calditrichaeota bacterium]|nr:purine-binding chemotaxis protein CheW [Calditrichota bacterium]